jgi:hypothetical protein
VGTVISALPSQDAVDMAFPEVPASVATAKAGASTATKFEIFTS